MKKLLCFMAIIFCVINSGYAYSPYDTVTNDLRKAYVDSVDFLFTDVLGSLRSVTVPTPEVANALKRGMDFDGSSIPGYSSIYESDMHLKPDMRTFQIIENKAHVMCDVYSSSYEPYSGDPRCLLKKQLARAQELGYEFYVGPELEFFLLDGQKNEPIDTNRYFNASDNIFLDDQKRNLLNALVRNNINVEKLHHEVAAGQYEISVHYNDALTVADQIVRAKQTIKLHADASGLRALFMPKPFFGMNGSGMHVHFSLYDTVNKKNSFYDNNDDSCLSKTARHFIAGVLKHMPMMSAICNPTINSYKRLVAGYEAPVYICWAKKNRSALIRIPHIDKKESSAARAELRSPDAMSNPYTLFALLLAAGLQGIEDELELTDPIEHNLYKFSTDQIKALGITTLPSSLEDALVCLAESDFARHALGEQFIREFVDLKRKEVEFFNRSVTDWEWHAYA